MNDFDENSTKRFYGNSNEYKIEAYENNNGDAVQIIKKRKEEEKINALKKYMPIGSIITLKEKEELIMIIGFKYNANGTIYDYLGCIYPFGIDKIHKNVIFNHEKIDKVYYTGYMNEQGKSYKTILSKEDFETNGIYQSK